MMDQYPSDVNYKWYSYEPNWTSDVERISSIYGALGVTTYTMDGSSDSVNVTVTPF